MTTETTVETPTMIVNCPNCRGKGEIPDHFGKKPNKCTHCAWTGKVTIELQSFTLSTTIFPDQTRSDYGSGLNNLHAEAEERAQKYINELLIDRLPDSAWMLEHPIKVEQIRSYNLFSVTAGGEEDDDIFDSFKAIAEKIAETVCNYEYPTRITQHALEEILSEREEVERG